MSDLLLRLHGRLSGHLSDIEGLFKEPVKVTLCVRNPAYPNGERNVVISSEANLKDAADAIVSSVNDMTVTVTKP